MSCQGITMGAVANCDVPLQPGVRQRVIIGNLDDIETITYDVTKTNLITDITMKTATQAWEFEGLRTSISASWELVASENAANYNHLVNLSVYDMSSEQKLSLQGMAWERTFAIVENRNDASLGDSIFEAYGLGAGMLPLTMGRQAADTDTQGAVIIELGTPDFGGKETTIVESWFDTSYAATLVKVDALLTPAV